MTDYFVKRGDKVSGPMDGKRLKQLGSSGKLKTSDLVGKTAQGPFQSAGRIPGLLQPAIEELSEEEFEELEEFDAPPRKSQARTGSKSGRRRQKLSTPAIVIIGLGIFIFGGPLFLALLLPAIQQGRVAARRSISRNNEKHMALALREFHHAERHYPPKLAAGEQLQSWQTNLLPYLEQKPLYEKIDRAKAWDDPANAAAMQTVLPQFINPEFSGELDPNGHALSYYAGNPRIMTQPAGISLRRITDGSSTTIVLGEVRVSPKAWGDPANLRDFAKGLGDQPDQFNPDPLSGCAVLMADGSVRLVRADVDLNILKALSTPHGGEVIPRE